MQIKLAPKQVDSLWDRIKDLVELVRAREKAIMEICVVHARMPRKTFIKTFISRETDTGLYRALLRAAGDNRVVIEQYADEIKAHRGKPRNAGTARRHPDSRIEGSESQNVYW